MVAQIAVAAMQLQAAIDHLETGIGGQPFGFGGELRGGGLAIADRYRGAMQQQARRFQLGGVVGNAELQGLEIGEPRAELLALLHVVDGAVETELRAAERAGADICLLYTSPSP